MGDRMKVKQWQKCEKMMLNEDNDCDGVTVAVECGCFVDS